MASSPEAHQLWRDIASAAESGWDFSSRWLADGVSLCSIRTTQVNATGKLRREGLGPPYLAPKEGVSPRAPCLPVPFILESL